MPLQGSQPGKSLRTDPDREMPSASASPGVALMEGAIVTHYQLSGLKLGNQQAFDPFNPQAIRHGSGSEV